MKKSNKRKFVHKREQRKKNLSFLEKISVFSTKNEFICLMKQIIKCREEKSDINSSMYRAHIENDDVNETRVWDTKGH